MIRLQSVAIAAVVSLVGIAPIAWASPAEPPAAATVSPRPDAVPGQTSPEQRVEAHIKQLHAQLRISPAEEPQWRQFADVIRANARAMDDLFTQRAQRYATMNALQDMQSYEQLADTHAQHVQKLVPAFASLYNAMPPEQQRLTDQVFRANAEARVQHKMQTGERR